MFSGEVKKINNMRMKEFFMEAKLLHGSGAVAVLFAPRTTYNTGPMTQGKKKGPRKKKNREEREHAAELAKYAQSADCRDGL